MLSYYRELNAAAATLKALAKCSGGWDVLAALAWTTTSATFVASTTTGRYTQVTPAYGFAVTGQGPAVLVADAPTAKGPHPSLALHVVDARRNLPAAPCTG